MSRSNYMEFGWRCECWGTGTSNHLPQLISCSEQYLMRKVLVWIHPLFPVPLIYVVAVSSIQLLISPHSSHVGYNTSLDRWLSGEQPSLPFSQGLDHLNVFFYLDGVFSATQVILHTRSGSHKQRSLDELEIHKVVETVDHGILHLENGFLVFGICETHFDDSINLIVHHKMNILIPYYIYPTTSGISKLLAPFAYAPDTKKLIAVLNPASGPGTGATDNNYKTAVRRIKDAGHIAAGYVHTSYAKRDSTVVKAEIDRWVKTYKVQGLFLDEATVSDTNNYYANLAAYARTKGITFVVTNPGTQADTTPTGVDVVVIWEDNHLPSPDSITGSAPANRALLVYGQATKPDLSPYKGKVGWVYATPDVLPNPWDTLPTYWQDFVATV